jgi:hypothetical protein
MNRRVALPVVVVSAGLLATLAIFYPGVLSNDAVAMYRQIAYGWRTDVKPPLFVDLWRLTDRVVCGSGGIFFLHVALYWAGVLALATGIASRASARALAALMLGFVPALIGRLPMVSVDNAVVAAWMLAVGLLLHRDTATSVGARRALSVAAFLLFAYGTFVRHNAITGVVPLLWWLVGGYAPQSWSRREASGRRAWAASLALTIALASAAIAFNWTATRSRSGAQTPMWDVAAISVAAGDMRFPPELMLDPSAGGDLALLEKHFSPWSVSPLLYQDGGYAVLPRNDEEAAVVARAWRDAVTAHPAEYLRHRGFVFLRLLAVDVMDQAYFWEQPPASAEMEARCGEQSPSRAASAARKLMGRWLAAATRTPLYRTWMWALAAIALLAAAPALTGSAGLGHARAIRAVTASGLLYVAPLAVAAPGVEFRYTLWLYAATAIGAALAVAGVARRRGERAGTRA